MKYMLLMYANESDVPKTPEEIQAAAPAWQALGKETQEAGVYLSSNGLDPVANATTVRVRNSKTLTTDGPFAETHEQLGGYWLLDCKDLDEAIRWAAKIPTAKYGSIEIRPLWGQNQ
jgi:hypothetical protein